MYILGINSVYHESAAALVKDGEVVAAAEEERFSRVKHAKLARIDNPHHLPRAAIAYCLHAAGIRMEDVNRGGFSFEPIRRLKGRSRVDTKVLEGGWGSAEGEEVFYRSLLEVPERLGEMGFRGEFRWLRHSMTHAASAFYPSPFPEAAILSVDGIGETESTVLWHGTDNRIRELSRIEFPSSIGFLWEKLSMFFGFSEYDACKLMSLAAYGNPQRFMRAMNSIVSRDPGQRFKIRDEITCFRSDDFGSLEQVCGIARRRADGSIEAAHCDLAASLQLITTEILLDLAGELHDRTGCSNLCMAGGVALNCVANGRLLEEGPFDSVYVQPAANDAGTALGAALYLWYEHRSSRSGGREGVHSVYLGPEYDDDEIVRVLDLAQLPSRRVEDVAEEAAARINQGDIVGWFQGRMEFGPRALGNRSLLADPRSRSVVHRLNAMTKHREEFRPFCPSVLSEEAEHWFEIPKSSVSLDHMLLALRVRTEAKERIPAVVHVDGTSRIQTVSASANPKYYRLLKAFHRRTGIPILLNTSFNDREPIVCSPEDAVKTFLSTGIDCLVLGDYVVDRRGPSSSLSNRNRS